MGLIHDEKIPRQLGTWATGGRIRDPAGREKLLQDVRLPQVVVGGDNARECAPRVGVQAKAPLNRVRFGAVDQIEVERELRLHLALPLLCERRGRENQDPPHTAADQQFRENEASLDCLSQADVVREQQRYAWHLKGFQQRNELKVIHLDRAKE